MPKLPIIFIIVGCIICGSALLFKFNLFPNILEAKIWEQSKLENGTSKWEHWRVIPLPVYQKLYIFNVTNPKDVIKGEKPILQELGPYVYEQKREKVDIRIDDEHDTIFYKHHDVYFFRPDMSNGELTDKVTVPNLPFIGTVTKAVSMGTASRYLVSDMIAENFPDEGLYVNVSVDEFLFGGYFVPFMKELSDLKGEVLLPNNTFGIYYNKNGTDSPLYEIYSGVKDPLKFGQVASFNHQTEFNYWNDPDCNKIIGSDGTTMTPFIKPDRVFYLFVPNLCRSLRFEYDSDTSLLGIPGYRFTVPESFLADARTTPENRCYCRGYTGNSDSKKVNVKGKSNDDDDGGFGDSFGDDDDSFDNDNEDNTKKESRVIDLKYLDTCPKEGTWELSACRQGTPLVMSYPHFFMGSEVYLNQSIGLNPQKKKHQMLVDIEPTAAIALQVQIKVQMNIEIKPSKYFPKLKKIPEMVHPIFWMEQGATLNPPTAELIKDKLIRTKELAELGAYCVFGFGCICILTGVMIFICRASSVKHSNKYDLNKKASLKNSNSYDTEDTILEPSTKSDWSTVAPAQKYSIVQSSPLINKRPSLDESQPFLQNQPTQEFRSHENTNGYNNRPINLTNSPPTPTVAKVVAVYPKLPNRQPNNSPYQMTSADETDYRNGTECSVSPSKVSTFLGEPFPLKNEFSSTNSMDNALHEMDTTLKGIQETLSSYENL